MKKIATAITSLIIALLAIICAAGSAPINQVTASAEEAEAGILYARADSREAYFYTSPDISAGLFAVPYTYCVEVLSDEGDWYYAKYAEDYGIYRALYGYVRKSDFTALAEAPQTVYLYKSVSVTFTQDAPAGGLPVIDDITLTAAFYGNFYSGAAGYSYILCQGSFGYIAGANEDYPLTETPSPPSGSGEADAGPSGGSSSVIAWVILGVLAALALAIAALSGRKRARKKRQSDPFADENSG